MTSKEPSFAVVDGAQFPDLPALIASARLEAWPLYRNDDPQERAAAPHMIGLSRFAGEEDLSVDALPSADVINVLRDALGDTPAMVVWQGCAHATLFQHLRGLNMVEVPRGTDTPVGPDYAMLDPSKPTAQASGAKVDGRGEYELILFRHADPNVIAQILPALDLPGWARFLGRTNGLAYTPADDWSDEAGTHVAPRPGGLPETQRGWLRLERETLERMAEVRLDRSARRIARYLRKHAATPTKGIDDQALVKRARGYIDEARDYGVQTEAGMGRWSYMQITTRDGMLTDPSVRSVMSAQDPSMTPDERVKLLLRMSATSTAGTI
ncbi:hypothetical protein [uncultured Roseobacter sp.]|uniref:hypothetical protein n=1 Tax=uncultured Roseobacter sp. TaxID=114847 RepID=UPI00262ACF30|nr:hypothetical protein [uncultured Roseobacter sp.]